MKQQQLKALVFLAVCLVLANFSRAQRFDSLLTVMDGRYPQEKIYLHFDRAMYTPGETIWFKAYLFAGAFPSAISKTVYAELIDDQGKLLDRKSAPVMMSGAAAAFDLPADLKSPYVFVRAYTRWMLNFDSSFLFEKAIPIASKRKAPSVAANPTAFLQFFPEGGNLVAGLPSRIAFKATDNKGLPIPVKGEIVGNTGKKVYFTSEHDGMGYFMLEPVAGEQYKAVWKDPAGKNQETALPAALASGLVLEANNQGGKIDFTLRKSQNATYQAAYVVAQMHQQLLYRAKANLINRTSAGGSIPLQNVPAGIVQITVFTEDEKPLAERIVFVNQEDNYFITDLNAAAKNLVKRGRNVIQIDVPDTIACNLSVSVTDAGLNPATKSEEDIFSSLLLTSDIKGYVHQPAYYFTGSETALRHLDLVMMTNGWRRFRWEEVLAGRFPTLRHEPDGYLAISGKVSGINKSLLVQREVTGMLETKNGRFFLNAPINPLDGQFSLSDLVFYDTAKVYYQLNNDKDKTLTTRGVFEFRSNLYTQPVRWQPSAARSAFLQKPDSLVIVKNDELSQKRIALEDERKKVQTLAAVEVKARQKTLSEKMDEQYTSGLFSGDGTVFVVGDDPTAQSAMSIFTYLQGRVAGLQITNAGTTGEPTLSWRGGTPSLFLDEMQRDAATLQSIPMSDVAMIKVFRPPFLGGFGGGDGGGIAVYTKKGSAALDGVKGLDAARIVGYSPVKEFYSPDYSKYDAAHDQPDYRTTLYWNPMVLTDKQNRRILLTFHNNDVTRRIRVVVEGVDADGRLTRMEKVFE
jgi:hypothetical protein